MRVIATITEPQVVRQILEHLGVRASPLPRAPAPDPALEQVDLGFDDAALRSGATSPPVAGPRRPRRSRSRPASDSEGRGGEHRMRVQR